ncbi:MAG: tetratricopeptide repeat protein [Deltaproteobacteria bacterium]|nr:tetratricopeptide repeat protein [Deltaproteobacteria bacterium]
MIRTTLLLAAAALTLCACGAFKPVAADPLSGAEHLRLGGIFEAKGDYALAYAEYCKAAGLDEADAAAWFAAANMELRLGKLTEAEWDYKKAVLLAPDEAAYHNNLGWLYMEIGDLVKAGAEVETARALDPAHSYVYLDSLGVIAMRAGNLEAARRYLEEAVAGVPAAELAGAREIYTHLLELYGLTGDSDKAAMVEKLLGKEKQ